MHSTGEGLCQNCLRSSTDRTTVPGEHKFQPALPYTMNAEREKCNTSLSQAIPVPNSSLYIICWFIINRLPLQFWSRYFLWINAGPCYFFFPLANPSLANLHMSTQRSEDPCKPQQGGGMFYFWSGAWGAGVIWGLLLEMPPGDLLSFAFPRLACAGRLRKVPFIND